MRNLSSECASCAYKNYSMNVCMNSCGIPDDVLKAFEHTRNQEQKKGELYGNRFNHSTSITY